MPLLFDMPKEQLWSYQGINPRPSDHDAYWEAGLAEMRGVDPHVELKPAKFQAPFAECFHLFFTGVGGARIHAKFLRPRNGGSAPHPAVLMFHGYNGASDNWLDKLPYAAAGFSVAALDCRGQGGMSEDNGQVVGNTMRGQIIRGLDGPPEKLLMRQIFLDVAQLAGIVMAMPDVDEGRVGATGLSQGGALTLVCAALEPRLKLAAPVFPFLSDYKRIWELDLAKDAYEELRIYLRAFDPRHEREKEIFTKLGYIDIQFLCPRVRAEVMMATGLMDTLTPPSTQFAAYNKITSKKSVIFYPNHGHEPLPRNSDDVFEFMQKL